MGKSIKCQLKVKTAKDPTIGDNTISLPESVSKLYNSRSWIPVTGAASIWPGFAIGRGAYVSDLDIQKVCHTHTIWYSCQSRLIKSWEFQMTWRYLQLYSQISSCLVDFPIRQLPTPQPWSDQSPKAVICMSAGRQAECSMAKRWWDWQSWSRLCRSGSQFQAPV